MESNTFLVNYVTYEKVQDVWELEEERVKGLKISSLTMRDQFRQYNFRIGPRAGILDLRKASFAGYCLGLTIRVDYNTNDGGRGKFARLENCPKLNVETMDKHDEQKSAAAQRESSCFESNLYGPWMLAGSRRRKPLLTMRFETGVNERQPDKGCSLHADFVRNEAYLKSNPDKKKKNNVPTREGVTTKVVNHVSKELTNYHTAIQIVEHDAECSEATCKGKKSTGGSKT
ncbi:hypothetical protein GQ457_01G019340 [Hibiscus cannabinus]